MTSRLYYLVFLVFLSATTQVCSSVVVYPTTGLYLTASPGISTSASLQIKPDESQLTPVKYRLASFRVNGVDVDKSKLTINNLYLNKAHTLDRFQLVLSGKEKSNPVTSIFKFKPSWTDIPGNYSGYLMSDSGTRDIPIKMTVHPKTSLKLSTESLKITTSNFEIPKIQTVDVVFGSNSPGWELYLSASNLTKFNGDLLDKNKIYVRIKDNTKSSWINLDQIVKIAAGGPKSPNKVATLEFLINADKLEKAGDYLGRIKFLLKSL